MRGLFVTGTDTGVGKTVLSAALVATLSAAGEPVRAFKPVVTGLDAPASGLDAPASGLDAPASGLDAPATGGGGWPADHVLLGMAAGMAPEEVAPLRFAPAVSPHLAAAMAGEQIEPELLLAAARSSVRHDETLIAEGVGGLLVPLREDYSVCDFALALGLPVLIAARPGLGTINHALLTLNVARAAGLDVRAVVLTPWPDEPTPLVRSNRDTIAGIGEVEVRTLRRIASPELSELARAGGELPWQRWLRSS
jgi:dethiobiotin synthetase